MESIQVLDYVSILGPYFTAVISAAVALKLARIKSKPFIKEAVKDAQTAEAESQSKFRDDLMCRICSVTDQNEKLEKRLRQCVDECHMCKEDHAEAKISLLKESSMRLELERRVTELESMIAKMTGTS